jgi:LBP / BPI / CETP family, C-terminal domain
MMPSFDGTVLRFNMPVMTTQFSIIDTAVHPVSELALNTIVNDIIIRCYVLPALNQKGNQGIPLPRLDQVQFINAGLQLEQNALCVSTDLKYVGIEGNTIHEGHGKSTDQQKIALSSSLYFEPVSD